MGYVFWCAACGNPDVIVEKTKSGYSMGKGIVGAAVLGPVGAVAGLDGKETAVYYCPKCGAKLNHSMPDYEVSSILRLLQNPELFRNLIEQKHKKYPNMMMPQGWVEKGTEGLETDGDLDFEQLRKILQSSDEYNCGDNLYKYILQYGKITSKQVDTIKRKLEKLNLSKEKKLFEDALDDISNGYGDNYKVRLDFVGDLLKGGYTIYTAARDIDEIKAWRLEMKAQKKVRFDMQRNEPDLYKAYEECVRNLIGDTPVTIEEAEQAILEKNPNINDDNPYMLRQLTDTVCRGLGAKDARIQFDGEVLQVISTKRAEDEMRWEIEEKWKDGLAVEKAALMRKIAPVLKEGKELRVSDVCDRAGVQPVECSGLLTKLSQSGLCEKSGSYFSLKTEYRGWSVKELGDYVRGIFIRNPIRDLVPTALECLKVNSGKSFWSIMGDHIKSSYQAEQYYKCFMLFEMEGNARRTEKSKEYTWEFIDKYAEARKELEERKQKARKELIDEKQRHEQKLERIKKENEKKIPEWEEKAKKARSRVFDGSELMARISELESTKNALEKKLSSLGFFSFKEKKQVNQEIIECDKKLEEARGRLDTAQEAFNQSVEYEISSCQENIEKANNEIAVKSRQIQVIENKIKCLDDEKLVKSISDLEAILTTGKPAISDTPGDKLIDPPAITETDKAHMERLKKHIAFLESDIAKYEIEIKKRTEEQYRQKNMGIYKATESLINTQKETLEKEREALRKSKESLKKLQEKYSL